MPEVNQVQRSDVRAAIARASAATGVNFDYLIAQAGLESAFDPEARASTSSAAGLYQFTSGTWLETLERHGSRHGLGWAAEGGAARSQVLDLRFDAGASALMAAELARDNATELRGVLGREPDSTELYLAHFLGAGGARTFLSALYDNPDQSAAAILPQPAAANHSIFYVDGRSRTVREVMDLMRGKVAAAMEGGLPAASQYSRGGSITLASNRRATPPDEASRVPSMADTLQATFGAAGNLSGTGGERVQRAYAAIRTFGL